MKWNTSMLDGVQTPNLSTTRGKTHPMRAASPYLWCHTSFSILPFRVANLDEKTEWSVLKHQNEGHSLQKYQNTYVGQPQ